MDNPGSRFLLTFFFYGVHQAVFLLIERELMGVPLHLYVGHEAGAAVANSLMAMFFFAFLNRLKVKE